jgi:uncharacterized cysteine cluster protein YcgN (CxxCxxCC family)
MKIQWSAFFSVLTLATLMGCGAEQFGTTPQSSTSNPDAISSFEQNSCSSYTLVKPKVDIIYMIDNTQSYYYSSQDLKNAISGTLNQVSSQFDYRIITTTLVNPIQDLRDTYTNYNSSTDNSDYRILTNSSTALPSAVAGNKVISVSEMTSFITVLDKPHRERGLWRLKEFMKRHKDTGLLRQEAYQLIVMVSNNRDMDVENVSGTSTSINQTMFDTRLSELNQLRAQLQSKQTRIFSVTAQSACQTGWIPSTYSYVKMSQAFGISDNYDLCSGSFASIFSEVNSSIQQVIVPHKYRYWPITFLQNDATVSNYADLKVYKISADSAPALIPSSSYQYYDNGTGAPALNTLTTTNPSEVVTGRRHFVKFNTGAEVTYPDCVQIRTTSKTEFFGYVVLQREPKPETIYVTINGSAIPQSATDGWTYRGNISVPNIKVTTPTSNGSELPAIPRSGFMIQLNGADNYYKSGDNVQVNFIPAAI